MQKNLFTLLLVLGLYTGTYAQQFPYQFSYTNEPYVALTNGTVLSVNAINSSFQCITPLSSTQALIAYSGGGVLYACTLNVSGTTLTNGTELSLTNTGSNFPALAAISSTQAVIAYTGPTAMFPLNARTLNVSGTTVTAGAILVQPTTPVQSVFSSLKKISANKLALLNSVDALGSGATYGALAVMTETKVLAVYPESSGYLQARILEIGA